VQEKLITNGSRGWALNRVHNTRWPLDHLLHLWPRDLDLILIGSKQALMVDYPRDKFGDCSFSHFGFIVCGQTNTETYTDNAKRCTT